MSDRFELTLEKIVEIDAELESEKIPLHNRPFIAATRLKSVWVLGGRFTDPIFEQVAELYRQLYPQGDFGAGGILVGAVILRDQAYLADVNIGFGNFGIDPLKQIQISQQELEIVWQLRPNEIWRAIYSVWDLWDFAYGSMDLNKKGEKYPVLWQKAAGHIEASARTLTTSRRFDTTVQSSCLAAELSMKAALLRTGASETALRKIGHDLTKLAERLIGDLPLPSEDYGLRTAIEKFPSFVKQRYGDVGVSSSAARELALSAQFVAATSTRRCSDRNIAGEFAKENPARMFF